MFNPVVTRNTKSFREYNEYRKNVFFENSPRDSERILYFLPWLLSVNEPECPGYIDGLKRSFRVFGVENCGQYRHQKKNEDIFKRAFGIRRTGVLLESCNESCMIHAVYTIGSAGTISQTRISDCDIWICFNRADFDPLMWKQFNQKINLIKDWFDNFSKIQVYFFLCDIEDIRKGNFGSVGAESSGSTQKNVLKEEFYRTSILICGKIPCWWVSYEEWGRLDYNEFAEDVSSRPVEECEYVDLGNLEMVERQEYFGAALWQLNKSMAMPLKSIIKMALLKMQLEVDQEDLICHRFRMRVLSGDYELDPMAFTMEEIFRHYSVKDSSVDFEFLKECFYLKCELSPYDRKNSRKNMSAHELFKKFRITKEKQIKLSRFDNWTAVEQLELGNSLFDHLMKTYEEIKKAHEGIASLADLEDLTVLGRKIACGYHPKPDKIDVLLKPSGRLNLGGIRFIYKSESDEWHIFSATDRKNSLYKSDDITAVIAFMVWNDFFESVNTKMEPNPSSVTLQEILNLASRMKGFIGACDVFETDPENYLEEEYISKAMVIINFEAPPIEREICDIGMICRNTWGELFAHRFYSVEHFGIFLGTMKTGGRIPDFTYYLKRNSIDYDRIMSKIRFTVMTSCRDDFF
jgi:adenylate cyclase class 1